MDKYDNPQMSKIFESMDDSFVNKTECSLTFKELPKFLKKIVAFTLLLTKRLNLRKTTLENTNI